MGCFNEEKMNWRKPIIFILLYLSKSKIPRNLKKIGKISKLSKEKAQKYQEFKLKKLLLYAWKNVPYYKKNLEKSKVVVNGKVNLKNFSKIPILTKEIIRKEGKNLYSKEKRKSVYENTSGGSTGEPIRFLQDKYYDDWNNATKIYYKLIAKQDVGERELRFWGSERDLWEGKEKLSIRLRNWLYNRKEFNAFKMSEKEMLDYVKKWNKYNPLWVEAYVHSIYEFAKFIYKNKLKIKSPKNGILTSAGTLYPEMKKTIEKVFRCKVYNRYGSREVGGIAFGETNLKISFWQNYLEIINKKIYITSLNNFSMPLIRYNIGDMAEFGKNKFDLKKVLGRETEAFKTKEGKIIDGAYFRHAIFFMDWVKKYQIIQKKHDLIIFKIVKSKKHKEKDLKFAEKFVKLAMGKDSKIKWEFVKEIKPSKSGKYLYTWSEVK